MTKIVGNDIASFQEDINYDTYKNNSNFVIMKATEGTGFRDPKLSRNQSEARRVGLPLGYYAFARPDLGNAPEAEAQYFLDQVGALKDGEVLALDYEVSKIQAHVDWCKKWLDYVFAKTGVRPFIYMSESYATGLDWTVVANAGYGLWLAKYKIPPTPDATFNTGKFPFAAMYQWSSSQQVPGITGNVDADVFYGDQTTFKKYGYKTPTPPTPPTNWEQKYNEEVVKTTQLTKDLATANEKISKIKSFVAGI